MAQTFQKAGGCILAPDDAPTIRHQLENTAMLRNRRLSVIAVAVFGIALVACSESPTAPAAPIAPEVDLAVWAPTACSLTESESVTYSNLTAAFTAAQAKEAALIAHLEHELVIERKNGNETAVAQLTNSLNAARQRMIANRQRYQSQVAPLCR
jgi:hypothetical protein